MHFWFLSRAEKNKKSEVWVNSGKNPEERDATAAK